MKEHSIAVVVLALSFLGSALLAPSVCSASNFEPDAQGSRLDHMRLFLSQFKDQQSLRKALWQCTRLLAASLPTRMEAATWALGASARGRTEVEPADAARVRSAYRDVLIDIYILDLIRQAVLDEASLSPMESQLIRTAHEECGRARDRGVSFEDLRHVDGLPASNARGEEVRAAAVETLDIGVKLSRAYLAYYVRSASMPGQEAPPP